MNGSLLNRDPLDPAITECPFDYYHALREDGGVFQVPDRNFFLVSRYDLVMQVVKDTDTFSSKTGVQVPSAADGSHRPREGIVRTLLTADPPEHRFYRNLVNKAFSLKRVSSWEPRVREEEVLRVESPVQTHFRYATKATELNGVKIPEGAGVGVMYGCANRDSAHFGHAETFDVQRNNASRHLAFSQGVHFCPGAPLARLESAIAFEQLFERLQNFQLDESRSDLRHLPSFTHRSLRKVQITFDRTVTATTR